MTVTEKVAPVRKAVTVDVPPARAFEVFRGRMSSWWPASHSIGGAAQRDVVIEPRTAGRWYEVGEDGSECDWGEVLDWDPPARLLLAWRIGPGWRYDPDLMTELEVRFVPVGEGSTRVELEHRLLGNMGEAAEAMRAQFDDEQGWGGLLARFATSVGA